MEYRVLVGGREIVKTEWPPMAQAAWHRAVRDEDGGIVELFRDGRFIARTLPARGSSRRWPDPDECGLREVVRSLLLLLRDDEWDAKEIAEAMTTRGLPTTRGRIDAMRGTAGRRAFVSHAEIVVLIDAVVHRYRTSNPADQAAQKI